MTEALDELDNLNGKIKHDLHNLEESILKKFFLKFAVESRYSDISNELGELNLTNYMTTIEIINSGLKLLTTEASIESENEDL